MSVDLNSLPPEVRRKLADVAGLLRGERTKEEWRAYRRRMAEIEANLAVENMHVSEEERAFFDFAFGLNLPERTEKEILRIWNRARFTRQPVAAE